MQGFRGLREKCLVQTAARPFKMGGGRDSIGKAHIDQAIVKKDLTESVKM